MLFTWLYITRVEDAIEEYGHYMDSLLDDKRQGAKSQSKLAKCCRCMPLMDWVTTPNIKHYFGYYIKDLCRYYHLLWMNITVCSSLLHNCAVTVVISAKFTLKQVIFVLSILFSYTQDLLFNLSAENVCVKINWCLDWPSVSGSFY